MKNHPDGIYPHLRLLPSYMPKIRHLRTLENLKYPEGKYSHAGQAMGPLLPNYLLVLLLFRNFRAMRLKCA